MRLHQLFIAITFIPAVQMSTVAQKILTFAGESTGEPLALSLPLETVRAPTPEAPERQSATATPAAVPEPMPIPTPLRLTAKSRRFEESYLDAYRILKEVNTCSRFFGGAAKATEVLNGLAEQFKQKHFDNSNLAVRMSGSYSRVRNQQTGAAYRLFDEVMVNTNGPLYLPPALASTHRQSVGSFRTDTRAARALILLHEIGHLLIGNDGHWLLPNDGNNSELSVQNTRKVESHCFKQLTSLR